MAAVMVERVDSMVGREVRSARSVRSMQESRSRARGPRSLRVLEGGMAGQAVAGSCRVSRPVPMEAPASGWRLTERGIAVVMGMLALMVMAGVLCVVVTFLQVTS